MKKGKNFFGMCFLLVAVVYICLDWGLNSNRKFNELFQVIALDVGQGSALYVTTPNGVELIADTGPSGQLFRSMYQYRKVFDRSIDYLLISHLDNDHMAMSPRLLSEYNVSNFITTKDKSDNGLYKEVINALQRSDTQILLPTAREKHVIDVDTHINYLWPQKSEKFNTNRNDTSLVFQIVHKNTSILFTGDISQNIEQKLVEQYGPQLESDILFVSHHGSKTSSSKNFIAIVAPKYAVIQSGKDNRYGHPHINTIETLNQLGIPILRNDQLGNIHFISDGNNILVQ